jgi:peptidyl-prolyl cis-trans isomerase B (cyclophilin B)
MPAFAKEGAASPRVTLETSKGTVVLELAVEEAPQTVESFVDSVASGFYDGTIFHRVIDGFMAQGGGYGEDLRQKSTDKALVNEADNGLVNERGTIAMARTSDPHSASVQFFINLVDNDFLNHRGKNPQGWGYAVFGRVVEGMEVVDAIAKAPTDRRGGMEDVPVETVLITRASVV